MLIATGGFLIDFCVVWPFIFTAASFIIYYLMHPNQQDRLEGGFRQIPTLSETGRPEPGRLLFTYGLHSQAILMAIFFTLAYVHFRNRIGKLKATQDEVINSDDQSSVGSANSMMTVIDGLRYCFCCSCLPQRKRERDAKFLHFWNEMLYILGLVASFLMSLVGTVTTGVDETVHTVFAATMYVCGILHMLLYYHTIMETMGYTTFQITLHRICLFVCIPYNFFMLIMILIMYVHCGTNYVCQEAAADLLITLEYTSSIGLIGYVYSFRATLQYINLFTMSSCPHLVSKTTEQTQTEQGVCASVELPAPATDSHDVSIDTALAVESADVPTEVPVHDTDGAVVQPNDAV